MPEIPRKYLIIGGIVLFLIVILIAVLLFAGSGNQRPANQEAVLTWWKTFEDNENISVLVEEYQKLNPDVTINFVKKDINDYEDELLDALASGQGPDIFTIHNDWLPKHMDKIAPLPESMMSIREYKDTFLDAASADFVKDNRIYAVPLSVDVLALYYNKDHLNSAGIAQPPTTWAEIVSAVPKLTLQPKPGTFARSGIAMGTSTNVNRAVDLLLLLMLQNGTDFYNADFTNAVFDQNKSFEGAESFSPGERALEYYTQFANPAKTTYTWNAKTDFSIDAFTQSKLSMMLSYSYMRPQILDRSPNLNWDVAAVPQVDKSGNKINFANYWGETVSKSSPNSLVAWDFLSYITQKEPLSAYYAKRKLVSSRKDLLTEQMSDPEIGVFAENALTAKSVYKKDANAFEGVFSRMIDDVVLRNLEADEAIRNAASQVNLNLNE